MTITEIVINGIGLGLIGLIVWYFWLYRREGIQIGETDGLQEATINVKGGYNPDVIVVKRDKPVRLHFNRQESSLCSEMVIFDYENISARLPEGQTVTVEFTPQKAGEIGFQCQMGMLRGKVIVQ
jgi:plastocyanin domain-containing protein